MRTFFRILLILSSSLAAVSAKPNVLLVFVDDLGWADVGYNGSKLYQTPNIDALAEGGAVFSQFYSAHPVCSPTRAALMSGKAPQRVGITQWISGDKIALPLDEFTIAKAFREGGYRTGYIGKWHLGKTDEFQPDKQGFEWVRAVNRAGQPTRYFAPYHSPGKSLSTDVPDLKDDEPGQFLTDSLSRLASGFIGKKSEKPFFLCLSQYAVHTPIQSPEELIKENQAEVSELYGDEDAAAISEKYGSSSRARQDHPRYAGLVENLDQNIGSLMKTLEDKGILENTIVVFTSDNGGLCTLRGKGTGPTSNLPLRAGKGWCYEGGVRVPSVVFWKGTIKATKISEPAITTDLYPTLLELAGLPAQPKQHLDGISLAPLIRGQDFDGSRRVIAWTYPHSHGSGHKPSNAIRIGDYKLIRFDEGRRFELYDLTKDPSEQKDLSDAQPKRVIEMDAKLSAWLKKTRSE